MLMSHQKNFTRDVICKIATFINKQLRNKKIIEALTRGKQVIDQR
jgi:hypothetical protein